MPPVEFRRPSPKKAPILDLDATKDRQKRPCRPRQSPGWGCARQKRPGGASSLLAGARRNVPQSSPEALMFHTAGDWWAATIHCPHLTKKGAARETVMIPRREHSEHIISHGRGHGGKYNHQ